jgi:DNA-directed RNA polymerase specialized sigma24 family protein
VAKQKKSALAILAKKINKLSGEKLTEQDLIDAVNRVAKNHKKKAFAHFSAEDIMAEVWVIILSKLHTYDPLKGAGPDQINSFERWFNKVVYTKLINFYRDEYSSVNEAHRMNRMNLMNALDVDYIISQDGLGDKYSYEVDHTDDISLYELKDFVQARLSSNCLEIYQHCLDDENVSPYYKSKLSVELAKIMEEWRELNGSS